MPTPVGHSLAGLCCYLFFKKDYNFLKDWKLLLVFLIAAMAGDLDFIPGLIIGKASKYHHGITHSIGFAFAAAFMFSMIFTLNQGFQKRFVIFSSLLLSHVFLDYFSLDTSFPYGIPLLWPLSERYYLSSVPVFLDIQRGSIGLLFSSHNWIAALREALIIGPFAVIIFMVKRYRARYLNMKTHR